MSPLSPRRPSIGERIYRRLLRLYPREFRDEFGAEMTRFYRDRARDEVRTRGPARGILTLWLGLLGDLLRTAPTEQRVMLMQDIRHAVHVWRRTPMLAATAILTLALGVGGNTAVFSVVHAVMLRPLPYPDADRLVEVWESNSSRNLPFFSVSPPNFHAWAERTRSFSALAASRGADLVLTGTGDPERVLAMTVTSSMFGVLGLQPIVGRPLRLDDERSGAKVVVLGESIWRERFGADPAIVGRSITLNGEPHEVIAVVPRAFRRVGRDQRFAPGAPQIFVPLLGDRFSTRRDERVLRVVGRLRDGVSIDRARDEMRAIAASLASEFPDTNKDWSVRLDAIADARVDDRLRTSLLILLGGVGLVMVIACANVANLLLARGFSRRRELALRTALGAGRARLVRQLLTESACLAAVSGGCGLLVAYVVVSWLPTVLPASVPQTDGIHLDGAVLGFSLALTMTSALIFGVAPALRATRLDLVPALAQAGKGAGGGETARATMRQGLVIAQVALATMMLVGAALLAQSFLRLQRVPVGFEAEGVVSARLTLPGSKYADEARVAAFHQRLLQTVSALPHVGAAALTTTVPAESGIRPLALIRDVAASGAGDAGAGDDYMKTVWQIVSADYFRVIGTPIVAGRAFSDSDGVGAPRVVIVSQQVARALWPDTNPIGRTIDWKGLDRHIVVGIAADIRDVGAHNREAAPAIYVASTQRPANAMTLVVRGAVAKSDTADRDGVDTADGIRQPDAEATAALVPAIRAAVREIDPAQPIYGVRLLRELLADSTAQPRFMTTLTAAFAMTALLLAAVGIYGVLSHAVGQRTQEIGVRMAMGAARGEVLRLVLRGGMTGASAGIVIGLAGAFAISRVLTSLLFEVRARDPLTFVAAATALALVALAACAVPAIRATRIEPVIALRSE